MAGVALLIQDHVLRDKNLLQAIEDWYKQVHNLLS